MTNLQQLALRIEGAAGPSRELDAAIAYAIDWQKAGYDGPRYLHDFAGNSFADIGKYCAYIPAFTASLDAALSLGPDEHRAGVLYHAMQTIQRTGFPTSTFLQRLILEVAAAALRGEL